LGQALASLPETDTRRGNPRGFECQPPLSAAITGQELVLRSESQGTALRGRSWSKPMEYTVDNGHTNL